MRLRWGTRSWLRKSRCTPPWIAPSAATARARGNRGTAPAGTAPAALVDGSSWPVQGLENPPSGGSTSHSAAPRWLTLCSCSTVSVPETIPMRMRQQKAFRPGNCIAATCNQIENDTVSTINQPPHAAVHIWGTVQLPLAHHVVSVRKLRT